MPTLAAHTIAQVVFQRTTGLAEDVVTNTFHFNRGSMDFAASVAAFDAPIIDFYNGSGNPVRSYINGTVVRDADSATINFYDGAIAPGLRTPTPVTFTLGAPSGATTLPAEVAVVLSVRSTGFPSVVAGRKRGRLYLGPLTDVAVAVSPVGDLRVSTLCREALEDAAQRLGPAAVSAGGSWCVYSPTNNALYQITKAATDNAFDSQRRRGVAASNRTEVDV